MPEHFVTRELDVDETGVEEVATQQVRCICLGDGHREFARHLVALLERDRLCSERERHRYGD